MNITTNRVEAFSDCVISIAITIMVFSIKLPERTHLSNRMELGELRVLMPRLISYVFSFVILGIMWLNHHHLFHMIQKVDEKFLWLNMLLLFWLSLIPFPTSMLGTNPFLAESAATYGVVLGMATLSFMLLRSYAIRHGFMYVEQERRLNRTIDIVNRRAKNKNLIAIAAYVLSIPLAFWSVYASYVCFLVSPVLFFIPDGIDDEKLAEKIIVANEDTPKLKTEDQTDEPADTEGVAQVD